MNELTRRSAIVGGCLACAAAVSSCAGYGAGTPAPAPAPKNEAAGTAGGAAAVKAVAAVGDVPVGGGVVLADKDVVITQPAAGTFKAFSATCTHQGCTVNEVKGGTINCPCHGSKFAMADGSPTAGPAKRALAEKTVTVQGSSIILG
jgi:Rieske Fe-S protein